MNILKFVLFIVFVNPYQCETNVPELDPETFHKLRSDTSKSLLVMFYAPWCPYCTAVKPDIFRLAAKVVKEYPKLVVGIMNCDDQKNHDLCTKLHVDGYPTIKYYDEHNNLHDYASAVNEKNLIDFLKNPKDFTAGKPINIPTQVEVKHVEYLNDMNFAKQIVKYYSTLVYYYASWCSHCQELKKAVDEAAKHIKTSTKQAIFVVNCDKSDSKKLCDQERIDSYPTVRYYREGLLFAEYDSEFTRDAYLAYLNSPPKKRITKADLKDREAAKLLDIMPEVQKLTPATFEKELTMSKELMVMYMMPWDHSSQDAALEYNKVAKAIKSRADYDGNTIIGAINCDHPDTEKLCDEEKIAEYPTFIHYNHGMHVKVYESYPLKHKEMLAYLTSSTRDEL